MIEHYYIGTRGQNVSTYRERSAIGNAFSDLWLLAMRDDMPTTVELRECPRVPCCGHVLHLDSFPADCDRCDAAMCADCGEVEGDIDGNSYTCRDCLAAT